MGNIDLKNRIMRRVRMIYVLRKIFNPVMYRAYLLAVLFGGIVSFVSVTNVFSNIPSGNISEFYNFSLYAFVHTELVVQVLTVGFLATSLWLLAALASDILRQPHFATIA